MAFSSITFLSVFLPLVILLGMATARHIRVQNACLLAASLLFYAYGDATRIALLFLSVVVNGFAAKQIHRCQAHRRLWVLVAVLFNLGMLFAFKYAAFTVRSFNAALGLSIPIPETTLPLGISFFTFQAMSYVLDVYRGKTLPAKSYATFLLYLCLFPQLIAGPIIKWQDMEEQLQSRAFNMPDVARGMRRFIVGLCKKVLLADVVAKAAQLAFSAPAEGASAPLYWLGALGYTLQIYLDFSSYSDMAVGLGHVFGFAFPENFRLPLCSFSMGEFWRRWHITLTDWFREYLYYPLGGNRKGAVRTRVNLMIVFLCTGLWHGANWTFVVWGLWNGLLVVLERTRLWPFPRLPKPLGRLYVWISVIVGFTLFQADSLGQGLAHLSVMVRFTAISKVQWSYLMELLSPMMLYGFVMGLFVSLGGGAWMWGKLERVPWVRTGAYMAALFGFVCCFAALVASGYHPFIYFRF